jgi:thioredoxin 1
MLLAIQEPPHPEEAQGWFYDVFIWVIVIVPILIVILLAALKRTRKPELPHVTDFTFELDVGESPVPVLIHAYHRWSIGDRVIEAQVEKVAAERKGRLSVLWLDIDASPGVVGAYPTLQEKSVALFVGRRLVWQSLGVQDHESILREIDPFLPKTPTEA